MNNAEIIDKFLELKRKEKRVHYLTAAEKLQLTRVEKRIPESRQKSLLKTHNLIND